MTGAAIVTNETAMAVGHQLAAAIMQVANSGAAPPANWIEVIANATVAAMLSVSQPPTTMAPAQPTPTPMNEGTTTFMFLSTSLVQFMTPGLALFYAGMSGSTSAVAIMLQNFVALGLVFILWVVFVFSLTFGEPWITFHDYHLLGNPTTYFMWNNVGLYGPLQRASDVVVCCFPGMLFAAYQGMFAVITPALISGGLVDRIRFGPYLIFLTLWLVVVYAPLGYWNWGGGWMFQVGAWDFAGGMVVHESSGFSALAAVWMLGKRNRDADKVPHNMPFIVLGTSMLWFGWFGFNAGSALASGGLCSIALLNSHLAASAGIVFWVILDKVLTGKAKLSGACTGCVAGLVVITPAAGFVQPQGAIMCGICAAFFCRYAIQVMETLHWDDATDVWGCHGVGGFIGTVLTGVLADGPECADKDTAPEWCVNPGTITSTRTSVFTQLFAAVVGAAFAFGVTVAIIKIMSIFFRTMHTRDDPNTDDVDEYGEEAYQFTNRGKAKKGGHGTEMASHNGMHSGNGHGFGHGNGSPYSVAGASMWDPSWIARSLVMNGSGNLTPRH